MPRERKKQPGRELPLEQMSSQPLLPVIRDYRLERDSAITRKVDRLMETWNTGLSGEAVYVAQCLIVCGLPLKNSAATHAVRSARLSDGSFIKVTFSRASPHVPLPFWQDRAMVHFLTHRAVTRKSPMLQWERVNEYLALFGLHEASGWNYRTVQERFIRVAYMDILVEYLDKAGRQISLLKAPLIEGARVSGDVDEAGNWVPSESLSKALSNSSTARVGQVFYEKLLKKPVPVPIELLRVTHGSPRIQDYALFIYWRSFAGRETSLIPWHALKNQFADEDTNPRRWPQLFKKALVVLRALPAPFNSIQATVSSQGLRIEPLAPGTSFFSDHPKSHDLPQQSARSGD